MVYQRVQKASTWIPATQRSNSSGSLHTHKLPTKAAGSVSSLQQKQESSQQFASDWMERDPVYRRIQAKMKATGEGASTDNSLAADAVQMKCSQCEAQEDVQQKPDSENSLEQEIQLSPQGQKSTEKSIKLSKLEEFIYKYRSQIKGAASEGEVDAVLIAAILHDELKNRGWEDDIQDNLANQIIENEGVEEEDSVAVLGSIFGSVDKISFGPAQMQQRLAVELVEKGYIRRPQNWSEDKLDESLKLLLSPSWSPYLIASRLQQTIDHWRKKGVDISKRPEILATLYHIGLTGTEGVRPNPKPNSRGLEIVRTMPKMQKILQLP